MLLLFPWEENIEETEEPNPPITDKERGAEFEGQRRKFGLD